MSKEEEAYIHFQFSIEALNEAWSILKRIKSHPKNSLRIPAFRYALIAYAKPYRKSFGIEQPKHSLDTSCIPDEFLELHERLVDSRDQIHAHSDLTLYEPKLYGDISGPNPFVGYTANYINVIEELPNIDKIIELIEQTLLRMYKKEPALRTRLAP